MVPRSSLNALLASAWQITICGRSRCRAVPAPRRVVSPGTYPCLPAAIGVFRGGLIDGPPAAGGWLLRLLLPLGVLPCLYPHAARPIAKHHH